ncbi:FAD-dependent oxidoreductase [Paenibacillus sp. S-38]|uniref:FAD-dependent oxidoreductase n=1 Tax=Paenibacillus sp. S-38 TaxID=3416710 RepID=UPI003CE8F128
MKHQADALIIGFGKAGKTLAPFLAKQGLKVIVVERCLVQNQPGVTVITGKASFVSAHLVKIETEQGSMLVEAGRIFITTGSVPVIPVIPDIQSSKVYTSAELLDLATLPERLAIIGGGYIGLEFASIFAGFGTEVMILEQGERFLPREDRDIAAEVQKVLEHKGIRIQLQTGVTHIEDHRETGLTLQLSSANGLEESKADAVLIATGRKANTDELNLEAAGINRTARGFIQVDEKLQTNQPHIWALGDVNGGPQFTYISLDDYRIVRDQWTGSGQRTTLDRKLVPYSVFIDPPLSHVGLTESEALKQGYHVKVALIIRNRFNTGSPAEADRGPSESCR